MHFIHRKAPLLFAVATVAIAALCKAADDPASTDGKAPQALPNRPLVALLLPLNAPEFAPPAEAVLSGCKAAMAQLQGPAETKPALEIIRTDASAAQILAGHDGAVSRGAGVIVGPLTRNGVTALVTTGTAGTSAGATTGKPGSITLALNAPEGIRTLPAYMYVFGLSIDAEARQVARTAYADNLREAAVVRAATVLARRASQAFAEEWSALGGKMVDVQEFEPQTDLSRLRDQLAKSAPHLYFLAADAAQARNVRPYLNTQVPVYSTSQINDGRADMVANVDLNGIRFVDMPWLAQPDNLVAMIYARPDGLNAEMQRFYALGIDACRIAGELIQRRTRLTLKGITGTITLTPGGSLEREAMQTVFRDGAGVALEEQ